MTILGQRLYGTVVVLGLRRIVIRPVAMSRVGGVMIVAVGMLVGYGKLWLLKKMMDTMGRGRREKKHKKGNDPQGADGTEITKCCSHGVDNYLYLGFWTTHSNQESLARASSISKNLIDHRWSETAAQTVTS